jgi:hypothetical protein
MGKGLKVAAAIGVAALGTAAAVAYKKHKELEDYDYEELDDDFEDCCCDACCDCSEETESSETSESAESAEETVAETEAEPVAEEVAAEESEPVAETAVEEDTAAEESDE